MSLFTPYLTPQLNGLVAGYLFPYEWPHHPEQEVDRAYRQLVTELSHCGRAFREVIEADYPSLSRAQKNRQIVHLILERVKVLGEPLGNLTYPQMGRRVQIVFDQALIRLFHQMTPFCPAAQAFYEGALPEMVLEERAPQIRNWMETHPRELAAITDLGEPVSLPAHLPTELLLLKNLSQGHIVQVFQRAERLEDLWFLTRLVHSEKFRDIPSETLGDEVFVAAHNGSAEVLQILMNSTRLDDIPTRSLGQAFYWGAANGKGEVLSILINSARFDETPNTAAYFAPMPNFDRDIYVLALRILIDLGKFNDIRDLQEALQFAERGQYGRAFQILAREFEDIPIDHLGRIFRRAAQKGELNVVRAFIHSLPRFNEIDAEDLGWIARFAAKTGNTEILFALQSSRRFEGIPKDDLRRALFGAVKNGHTDVIFPLGFQMYLSRDRRLSIEDLGRSLKIAAQEGRIEVLRKLLALEIFPPIYVDEALFEGARRGQTECFEKLMEVKGGVRKMSWGQLRSLLRESTPEIRRLILENCLHTYQKPILRTVVAIEALAAAAITLKYFKDL